MFFWTEDYKVNVRTPSVKIDTFTVSNIGLKDNKEYEFLYEYETNFEKVENIDIKKMLEKTYNIGLMMEKTFSFEDCHVNIDKNTGSIQTTEFKSNIFIKALAYARYQTGTRINSILEETYKELNMKQSKKNPILKKLYIKKMNEVSHNLYVERIKELSKEHKINNKDFKKLNKLLEDWIRTCGLPVLKMDTPSQFINMFPIVLFSQSIYNFINHSITKLEVNITHSMEYINGKYVDNLTVETINDLIKFLAMNFCKSGGYNYITCEVCGNLVIGTKRRHTCSEVCKKKRNKSYNKKSM